MTTCEKCGASFEAPTNVTEVTSLRVLCPDCTAARAAARAAKAAGSASKTPPMAPPIPAATLATRGSAPKARAEAAPEKPRPPAASPAKTPVAPSARPPAAPAAKAPVVKAPIESATQPQASRGAAPAKSAAAKKKKPEHDVDFEGLHRGLQKKGNRELIISFSVAAVVFVVAGLVLFNVLGKKNDERKLREAQQARIDTFKSTFAGMDIETPDGAKHLIEYSEETKALWNNDEKLAPDVISRTAKAKTYLEGIEERKNLVQRIEEVEATLAKGAELTPSEFAEQRRRLDELAPKAEIGGADLVARVAKDRQDAERAYLELLVATAQKAAAADPLDRAGLTSITLAEDEVLKIFENTTRLANKSAQDTALQQKKNEQQSKYVELIKLSDSAVERFFTPEAIEAVPWRDLLAADQVSQWKGPPLKGFEHRIENGMLHMIGPDPAEKAEGVISIGDKEIWRDFLIDMEFTIEKGAATIFFRLPPAYQENVTSVDMTTDEGQLEVGRSYTYTYRVIGSSFTEEEKSESSLGPTTKAISWTKIRKGAFAISIPKDTEIKFTRLRAKVLR